MEQQLAQKKSIELRDAGLHLVTDAYEGPFEVVLDLIERKKLSISELSLAQITDDYIAHVRGKASFPLEDASEFIAVAATLLVIKSKSLIPELELSEDEITDVSEFERRLRDYEKIRAITRDLAKLFGQTVLIARGDVVDVPIFSPSTDLSKDRLIEALSGVLQAEPEQTPLPEARVRSTVTIEEMMEALLTRVQQKLSLSFREFSADKKERVAVIVSFLALLELVKQGNVHVDQHEAYGDIRIENATAGVPSYG